LLSTDAAGMTYIRPVPSADIDHIEARDNDVEQPVRFYLKASAGGSVGAGLAPAPGLAPAQTLEQKSYPAYNEDTDELSSAGTFSPVMLHYTVNRPVGGQWGESDLAPVLKWLARYSNWLEDRARLNRFRNSFLFVVKAKFASETERAARQANLAAHPPAPGSILVTDDSETWEVLSAKLESADAATDGLALKKMVASGAGIPLHFLAEPESSTRTTAEAAGGPTYRHFEQRQNYFIWLIEDLLHVAINRRALVDHSVSKRAEIDIRGADISARDNVALSMAGQNIINLLSDLRDRQLITDAEYLRMSYRFAGEIVDVEEMLEKAAKEGPPELYSRAVQPTAAAPVGSQPTQTVNAKGKPVKLPEDTSSQRTTQKPNKASGGSSVIDPDTGEEKPTPAQNT
jgi:hypothetical protein